MKKHTVYMGWIFHLFPMQELILEQNGGIMAAYGHWSTKQIFDVTCIVPSTLILSLSWLEL